MRNFHATLIDIWIKFTGALMTFTILLALLKLHLVETIASLFLINAIGVLLYTLLIGTYYVLKDSKK